MKLHFRAKNTENTHLKKNLLEKMAYFALKILLTTSLVEIDVYPQ